VFRLSELFIFRCTNKLLTVNVFATVPRAAEQPTVGEPADDVLSINVPDAFPRSLAASSCGVYGSAAISCNAANALPAADAGKQTAPVSLRP